MSAGTFPDHRRLMAAVFLISVALIAYQIAVIQLLSYVQWYHYANVVISIALLGFGAAGTLLAFKREWLLQHSDHLLPTLMILSGLMMVGAVELSNRGFARFDSYLLFADYRQWIRLLINALLYLLPFLLGALALGVVFTKYVEEIGSYYFSNLTGSGIGGVLAAILAWQFPPMTFPPFMALLAIVAGMLLFNWKSQWYLLAIAVATMAYTTYRIDKPVPVRLSQYKSLSHTLNLPSSRILLKKPGPYGYLEVVSADALRYAPGLSLAFDGKVPVVNAVFNNGDWFGPVDSRIPADSVHLLDYSTMGLPYILKKRNTVLVLNAGMGLHVSHALHHGARLIDAVEPHRGIQQLLQNELAGMTDSLYFQPEVKLHLTEPRTFISATQDKYDLIQLPMTGSFGGGVGLYALREEYTLTREAFVNMLGMLEDDGVISITSWLDYPFRNALKLTATLAETLEDAGIRDPRYHLAAIRSWGTITFLLKKTPFTTQDTIAIRRFCDQQFFDPLWLPGLKADERMAYNSVSDSTFFSYADTLYSGNREKLYNEYGFHIRPATDNKPYFSQFLRWKSIPYLSGIFGTQNVSFLELGWLIAAISFLQIAVLAVLLILLPLMKSRGWQSINKSWILLYFSGLGAGYMFLEIVLIQKFILFFGNPVYASAFVICIMLLASGAGSQYSSRISPTRAVLQRILMSISLILLLYTFFLSPLLGLVSGFSGWLKIMLSLPLVAIPASLMGMPFPLGLRALSGTGEKSIPWAWGINGCVSVISASLAALLVVEAGFSAVILLATISYTVSLLSMYWFRKMQIQ